MAPAKQRQRAFKVAGQQDIAASCCLAVLLMCLNQLVIPAVEATAQPSVRGNAAGRSLHRKLQQLFSSNSLSQGLPTPTASICPATQTKISCFDSASDVPSYICCPSAACTCNVSSRTCIPPNTPAPTAPVTPAPTATTPAPTIPYPGPPVKGTGQLDPICDLSQVTVGFNHVANFAREVVFKGDSVAVYYVPVTHNCSGALLTDLQVNVQEGFNPQGVPVVEGLTFCNPITVDGDPQPLVSCFLSPTSLSKYFVPPGFQPNQVIGQLPLSTGETYYFVFLDVVENGPIGRFYFEAAGAIFDYQA